ncbi:MAG: histidine kinase dimerization/phospho-acceptor domain-containing protein, partial [Anaerolineales bacterium]
MPTIFHSIRFRLLLWFTAILALVLIIFSAFIYFNQARDLEDDALGRLERQLARLQETVRTSLSEQDGQLVFPEDILEDTEALALIGHNDQVLASYGNFPTNDVAQIAIQASQNHSEHEETFENVTSWIDQNNAYAYVVAPIFGESGQTSLLVLGGPLDPNGRMQGLLTSLIVGSLMTLLIASGGGFWLADRAMRPVQTITHTARNIGETDLSRRINMEGKDELGELANTFDNMLARLQAAFNRQRQFVADASHELRTPLTIVNLETSRALEARRSQQEYERALRVIHSENEFMSHLVNDLLTLARMDNEQMKLEKTPLDLSDVAVDAIERLVPLADRKNVNLETGDLPEARMLGDYQTLLQMVSNLIENAIKYTEGDDKMVCIETGITEEYAWVRVSDNGPGINPEHLP